MLTQIVETKRDGFGRIAQIDEVFTTLGKFLSIAGWSLIAVLGFYLLRGGGGTVIIGFGMLLSGVYCVFGFSFRLIHHAAFGGLVADRRGVRFHRFYPNAGLVPWSEINSIVIEPGQYRLSDRAKPRPDRYLIARLNDPSAFENEVQAKKQNTSRVRSLVLLSQKVAGPGRLESAI